jgi:Xaa-Pro aminopeptidase
MHLSRSNDVRRLAKLTPNKGLLMSNRSDIRWLSGFSGSSGVLAVLDDDIHLFTDGRYTTQAREEAPLCTVHIVQGTPALLATEFMARAGVLQVQAQYGDLTHEAFENLKAAFPGLVFLPALCDMSRVRARKDSGELSSIREALRITEQTFLDIIPLIKKGISETEVAAEIDYRQRLLGAEKSSFETIVAFGAHSALPHARPGKLTLEPGTPILLDFGCVIDGYASDMTRMVHFGRPSSEFSAMYTLVEKAVSAGKKAAKVGMTGRELDESARNVFRKAGTDTLFSHSLGHGVGLDIHEWPPISMRNDDVLPSDCVITIEPGLYLEGDFGIRIEDMVFLSDDGCRVLNSLPTTLVVI